MSILDQIRQRAATNLQHIVLPEVYLYPLPAHLPLAAATLIETLATVRHAQQRARIASGESVVVLGQGVAGLLHTQLAKLSGARPVIAVSRSAWKLELARRRNADRTVSARRVLVRPAQTMPPLFGQIHPTVVRHARLP